jgi:serine/threonine protein kinase
LQSVKQSISPLSYVYNVCSAALRTLDKVDPELLTRIGAIYHDYRPPLLGKYVLQEFLKPGGIAEVWKAFDLHTGHTAIIQIPRAELRNNPHFMTYFWALPRKREAQVILSLQHPNIARIPGCSVSLPGETGNSIPYIVMDYIQGQSLTEYMRNTSFKGAFPSAASLVFLLQFSVANVCVHPLARNFVVPVSTVGA